jgi:hypothetical protein
VCDINEVVIYPIPAAAITVEVATASITVTDLTGANRLSVTQNLGSGLDDLGPDGFGGEYYNLITTNWNPPTIVGTDLSMAGNGVASAGADKFYSWQITVGVRFYSAL